MGLFIDTYSSILLFFFPEEIFIEIDLSYGYCSWDIFE